jgi:putative oxidoreductase
MKITALIARCLLGFVFLVFGLNGFLHFIPQPPMTGLALQFVMALALSHFMAVVFLLLINRYVPLALVLLGPVLANIVLFHAFMAPAGLPLPIILSVLWLLVAYYHRAAFFGLFQPQPAITSASV